MFRILFHIPCSYFLWLSGCYHSVPKVLINYEKLWLKQNNAYISFKLQYCGVGLHGRHLKLRKFWQGTFTNYFKRKITICFRKSAEMLRTINMIFHNYFEEISKGVSMHSLFSYFRTLVNKKCLSCTFYNKTLKYFT